MIRTCLDQNINRICPLFGLFGTVKDPAITGAQLGTIFNKAAIKSVLRYKYKPCVVDGESVEVSGVRTKITFELEE